jgi:hypothetical protein
MYSHISLSSAYSPSFVDGGYIDAPFFNSSGGKTENIE